MSRTCRTCGANATHHALEHIPRQIIDGRGREWNMQDEINKWYCDSCAPENAVPAKLTMRNSEPADALGSRVPRLYEKAARRPPDEQ